jgi:hypothetical protein
MKSWIKTFLKYIGVRIENSYHQEYKCGKGFNHWPNQYIFFRATRSTRKLAATSFPVPSKIVWAESHRTLDKSKPGTSTHGVCWSRGVSARYAWWSRKVVVQGASNRKSVYIIGIKWGDVRLKGCMAPHWPHWSHRVVDWLFLRMNACDKDLSFQSPHQLSNAPHQPPAMGLLALNPRLPNNSSPYWSTDGKTPWSRLLPGEEHC